jgi:hypothetical protein
MTDEELDAPVADGPPDPFEVSLRGYLDTLDSAHHLRRRQAKRLRRLLDAPHTHRRARKIAQLKAHLAVHLHAVGMTSTADVGAIDWQNINWDAVFDVLMKVFDFIMAILPLFL